MYNREAQLRATVTHLDLYYEIERLVGRELWLNMGHGSLEAIIKLTYERTQASKRLPDDHPLRQPDEVFWTDERQELANDIACMAVEDITAADWWADLTPVQRRELVLEEERQQEEDANGNGPDTQTQRS